MLLAELKEKMHRVEASAHFNNKLFDGTEQECYAFFLMAIRYRLLYKLNRAVEFFKKVIKISKQLGNKEIEGEAYGFLGDVYKKLGKYHEIKQCSENCLKIGKETRNKKIEAIGHLNSSHDYIRLGRQDEAISSCNEGMRLALQIDNRTLLGKAFLILGRISLNSGKLEQARRYFKRSLKIRKEIGDGEGEVMCHAKLGIVNGMLGKTQEAIKYYEEGLSISMDINDKYGEGILHKEMGYLYCRQVEYHKSLQCSQRALEIFEHICNRAEEGAIYLNFGRVCLNAAKFEKAFENLYKSLAIAIETDDKESQIECYGNLGIVHNNKKECDKAFECHKKCLNCALEVGDKKAEGCTYNSIGNVYLTLGNPWEAIKYFRKSLEIATSINDKEGEADAYYRLGMAYNHLKKYDEAIRLLSKSIDTAKGIDDKRIAGSAIHLLGRVYYKQSVMFGEEGEEEKCQEAKEKSEAMFKQALEYSERELTHLRDLHELKIPIVDVFIRTYKMLTEVLIERQKTDEALLVSDRRRARSLGDILVSKYGLTDERVPSQTPLDSTGLESVLSSNQNCILFFAVENKGLHAWVLTHQQPIVFVNGTISHAVKALQLEEGQSNIELNLQAITTNVVNAFYCKMPREMVTARCENRSFDSTEDSQPPSVGSEAQLNNTSMKSGERNGDLDDEPQMEVTDQKTDELEDLFTLLITPVMQHLQHEEIVIIPDGPLFMVPFAALRDPTTGKYLSETKSIRISPSLATLKTLQECAGDHHSNTGALIVGDPDVGEVMFKGETKEFDRLPSAEQEAESIANVLNATPLTGSQATKEKIKQKLREGVAVIHIAAHGDSEHGHIALAPPPRTDTTSIPEEQDYMLTMQEVQEIGVTAQLVVLSCCHSGRGDVKSEGVVGMSRAFLAAGARAVVASLWAVDDYATSRFMASFYASLKMGESASKSLQIAMDDIRDEEGYEDPMYWAPFFLIGDDVTISV